MIDIVYKSKMDEVSMCKTAWKNTQLKPELDEQVYV